jgi:hypothetical protein
MGWAVLSAALLSGSPSAIPFRRRGVRGPLAFFAELINGSSNSCPSQEDPCLRLARKTLGRQWEWRRRRGYRRQSAQAVARPAIRARRRLLRALARRPDGPCRQSGGYVQRDRRRESAHGERARSRGPGRRQGRQNAPSHVERAALRRVGRDGSVGQHAHRRSSVAERRSDERSPAS